MGQKNVEIYFFLIYSAVNKSVKFQFGALVFQCSAHTISWLPSINSATLEKTFQIRDSNPGPLGVMASLCHLFIDSKKANPTLVK